jgi:hypothetical protein
MLKIQADGVGKSARRPGRCRREQGAGLQPQAGTAESEYLIASQARRLMDRLSRDLEAAGIDLPRRQPAHGIAYLPVFAETGSALLTRLGVAP